jgi:hypothetical protein
MITGDFIASRGAQQAKTPGSSEMF